MFVFCFVVGWLFVLECVFVIVFSVLIVVVIDVFVGVVYSVLIVFGIVDSFSGSWLMCLLVCVVRLNVWVDCMNRYGDWLVIVWLVCYDIDFISMVGGVRFVLVNLVLSVVCVGEFDGGVIYGNVVVLC